MSDKEALQEIVFMVNDYINFTDSGSNLIVKLLEWRV